MYDIRPDRMRIGWVVGILVVLGVAACGILYVEQPRSDGPDPDGTVFIAVNAENPNSLFPYRIGIKRHRFFCLGIIAEYHA